MNGVVPNWALGTWRGWGAQKFQLEKTLDSGRRSCCYQDLHSRVSGGPAALERRGQQGGGRSVERGGKSEI